MFRETFSNEKYNEFYSYKKKSTRKDIHYSVRTISFLKLDILVITKYA